ncbi:MULTISPECIES: SDR family NAD(P)-dependent oxidoreductase [Bradyrhizobium]|uniref:Short-chain dehydrogenase/reductase SDR n=1 Tax=Bradyrhizobium vignae TaxID=1549949 RepID=A0A2U3Q3K3_9BRAD|nr:SDR family NAD(P)-dependent oxidoreductase [Bradyrhizobium vignae]SPP95918.1 Short-chain dehydrogenase/reductase SDR [Bradyrhizobium vignae]
MDKQVWFITGSTRGFGRAITLAALEAGHNVVATARRPEQLSDLTEQFGSAVMPLALDVTDAAAALSAIAAAVERFGRLDVVVNNAGYANVGPIETIPDGDFRAQFETNFWGVYNVTRAAVPVLREQKSGTIVQFSSIGGRVGGTPGLGSYQAAKFAVDGFTRVLAAEVAPFGIRCLVIEPSGFATDWAGSSMQIDAVDQNYAATVGVSADMMRSHDLMRAGDPARAADILVRTVARRDVPSHLPLGAYAASSAIAYATQQIADATRWQGVSASADFAEAFPIDIPAT